MPAISGGTGIFAYIVCAGSTGGFVLAIGTTCPTTSTAKTVTSIRLPHTRIISFDSGSPAHPPVQNPSSRTTGRFGLQALDPLLSTRIQQFNRKARKVRKGTCCIQRASAEEIGGTTRKVLVRMPSWLDESWRVFAIFAVLAVRFLGSMGLFRRG